MRQISNYLFVGDDKDCEMLRARRHNDMFVIHACKTCHSRELGYRGSLPKDDPHYLFYEKEKELFLNMIDPPTPLFSNTLFIQAISFINRHPGNVLIHCDKGFSRAPSVAIAYLANWNELPADSYNSAVKAYRAIDPLYEPGKGIAEYLKTHWHEITRGEWV